MKFSIVKLDKKLDYNKWQMFLEKANGSTIFHSLDFLSYHKNKFNEHHLGIFKGDELIGIIPLALCNGIAKSPYGASYGGFVFSKILNYSESKLVVSLFLEYLKKLNINEIFITPSLSIYYNKGYSETFLFVMLEQGFKIYNSDISSVVCLNESDIEYTTFTSKLRNMVRKAKKAGIVSKFRVSIDDFWILMEKTFSRHGTNPTHSKEEFEYLINKCNGKVYCNVAYLDEIPVAGVGVFELNDKNMMSFYLCSDENYKYFQPMSLIVYDTIINAKERGFKYFDFGTSSVNMKGRENIFRFKESFGAIGIFRHTYYWRNND